MYLTSSAGERQGYPFKLRSPRRLSSVLLLIVLITLVMLLHGPAQSVMALPTLTKSDDLYKELGLTKGAKRSEIKKAFRTLTMEHHPDLKESLEEKEVAKEKMLRILAAYEVLSDDEQRLLYDESGVVERKAPDPRDFTSTEELFQYYNLHAPLVSKSKTLESEEELERLLSFQGPKIFLIQVYADDISTSRSFADTWEGLLRHSLVQSGAVELLRIDAHSTRGGVLAKKLGVTMSSSTPPPVFALIDGERWNYHHPKDKKASHAIREDLVEFLSKFFFELTAGIPQLFSEKQLLDLLASPLPEGKSTRFLVHEMSLDLLPTALQARYPQATVAVVDRSVLLKFVEQSCGQKVEVRDRFGDLVVMPDFTVSVVGPLIRDHSVESSAETEEANKAGFRCDNVEVGVSAHMTYEKVSTFLEEQLPPQQPVALKAIAHVTDTSFIDICREDCLLYIHPECESLTASQATAALALLQRSYDQVKTGLLCLDQQPQLKQALETSAVTEGCATSDLLSREPFLAVLLNADDTHLYPVLASSLAGGQKGATNVMAVQPADIDQLLGSLLLAKAEGRHIPSASASSRKTKTEATAVVDDDDEDEVEGSANQNNEKTICVVSLAQPISRVLSTTGFPMSSSQRYSVMGSNIFELLKPMGSTVLPFLGMFLVHKFILNRDKVPVKPVNKTGKKMGSVFDEDDLDDAKEGRGFLVLVVDRRPPASGPLTLPPIATDKRFVVRVIGDEHRKWKKWIEKHKPKPTSVAEEEGTAGEDESKKKVTPSDLPEDQLNVLAIRQTKMTGAIKPSTQTVDAFLRDILDGTVSTDVSVPYSILM